MEQHPVPQQIAAFKFKLFGSLTAKQFFTLIIPLSLAALIFFSSIPALIRIPVSLVIGVFAFTIALVPIGGRSFDKWAIALAKAVMSPTQRVWVKEKRIPDFLTMIITPPVKDNIPEEITSDKKEKLVAYLKTLPKENASPLDVKEEIALQDIDYSVQPTTTTTPKEHQADNLPPPVIWPTSPITTSSRGTQATYKINAPQFQAPKRKPAIKPPLPKIEPHFPKLIKPANVNLPPTPIPHFEEARPHGPSTKTKPPPARVRISLHAKPFVVTGVEKRLGSIEPKDKEHGELISAPALNLASETNYTTDNVIPVRTPDNRIELIHGIGTTRARKLHFAPPVNFDISKLPIRGEKRFEVTDALKKRFQFEDTSPSVVLPIEKKTIPTPKVSKPEVKPSIQNIPQKPQSMPTRPTQHLQKPLAAPLPPPKSSATKFSVTDLKKQEIFKKPVSSAEIIPLTKTPNVISGQVLDSTGNSVVGAVLVVRDAGGIPIRALKTNKLGQFLSATPLTNGVFSIEAGSELSKFKPISINLKNEIVPPIAIKAEGGN